MFYSVYSLILNRFLPFSHHRTSVDNCVYGLYTVAPLQVMCESCAYTIRTIHVYSDGSVLVVECVHLHVVYD